MIPSFTLNTGASMPYLGLGLFKITDQSVMDRTISDALSIGYRLLDTASVYKNEAQETIFSSLPKSGIPPSESEISRTLSIGVLNVFVWITSIST